MAVERRSLKRSFTLRTITISNASLNQANIQIFESLSSFLPFFAKLEYCEVNGSSLSQCETMKTFTA